jgi:hypothetical protein
MDTISGDHRSVLGDNPISSEKPGKVSPKKAAAARHNRANAAPMAASHQSWADVVKSKPTSGSTGHRVALAHHSPILSV